MGYHVFGRWPALSPMLLLALLLIHTPGQAQTVAELQEKNRQLAAELQHLKAEYRTILGLTGAARQEIQAMAAVLAAQPGAAFDVRAQSGEMCFTPGHGDMVHYAAEPLKTSEGMIYMLRAQPFIDHGLQVSQLPPLPQQLGKMIPLQWYYYDGKGIEPHHGRALRAPYLMLAVDVHP
jgi:hypothetical protein